MTPEERQLITDLFDRIGQASNQPKDSEADQLIRSKIAANPSAAYSMVQSTLVLQQALTNAQKRIDDLQNQLSQGQGAGSHQSSGGFLSGVTSFFGGGHPNPQQPPPPPAQRSTMPPQYTQQAPIQQAPAASGGSGGFLKGALSAAAGVAGGAFLFRGIEDLIGHNPGPFAGAMGSSGGFMGQGMPAENTEIINNYYGDDPNRVQDVSDQSDNFNDPSDSGNYTNESSDFTNDDAGFQDVGGNDDSSLV